MAQLTANQFPIPSGAAAGGEQPMISFNGIQVDNSTKKVTLNNPAVAGGDLEVLAETSGVALFVDVSEGDVGINTGTPNVSGSTGNVLTIESPQRSVLELYSTLADNDDLSVGEFMSVFSNVSDNNGVIGVISYRTDGNTAGNRGGRLLFTTKNNGGTGTASMSMRQNGELEIDSGVIKLQETTTPSDTANYGAVYTKSDNNLYFQDGAGTEKTVLTEGLPAGSNGQLLFKDSATSSDLKTDGDLFFDDTNKGLILGGGTTATGVLNVLDNGATLVSLMDVLGDDGSPWYFRFGNETFNSDVDQGYKLAISNSGLLQFFNNDVNFARVDSDGFMQIEKSLRLAEITTPTALADYGAIYTKTDNKLYFQDGAGTEHEIAFV